MLIPSHFRSSPHFQPAHNSLQCVSQPGYGMVTAVLNLFVVFSGFYGAHT